MFKVLGSSLVLAISAGALYLWMHEHYGVDDLRSMGRHVRKTGEEIRDSIDEA